MKIANIRFCAVLFLGPAWVIAGQLPFQATATSADALPATTITAASGKYFDFLDTLVNSQGAFQPLNNRPYTAAMTFLGVPNAVRYVSNAAGTSVNVLLTPTGFTRTFTGASKQAVDDQIKQFFKKDGGPVVADFLKAVARTSPIAVTDGNPTAATAVAAAAVFTSQGFTSADELADASAAAGGAAPKFGGLSFGLNAGHFEAGPFEGKFYDFSATLAAFGGGIIRLEIPASLNFLKLDGGSKVGGAAINVCLPIQLHKMTKTDPWNWRVTPLLGLGARGSVDLASLAPLWQGGVINTVDYRATDKLVVSMVNQLTLHKSLGVSYDDLDFDPRINQQILKNGVRCSTPLSPVITLDGFVVHTHFFKEAAVNNFWTLGGAGTYRLTPKWNLALGFNYDTGDNFKSYGFGFSSAWKW